MRKSFFRLACTLMALMCLAVLLVRPARAAREAADATSGDALRFGADGTFTVMLLADLQDTQLTSPFLLRAMQMMLTNFDADLVVLLGDQVDGKNPLLHIGSGERNVRRTIDNLLQVIHASEIPCAVVFGNHDYDAPMPARLQRMYYAQSGCLNAENTPYAEGGDGAFALPVHAHASDEPVMVLYFFDCGADLPDGGYGAVSAEQVAWYVRQSEAFSAANGGQVVPAAAFCHVTVPEIYDLLEEAPAGAPGAAAGVGTAAGRSFYLASDRIFTGEMREAPCPSTANNGLFDAFRRQSDVFLSVSGHDHINSYIASLDGIDLAAAPGSTFAAYGSAAARGVRLFRFFEHNVQDYETTHALYSDYLNTRGLAAAYYYMTTSTRIPAFAKVFLVWMLLAAAFVTLLALLLKKDRTPDDTDCEKPENPYL